MFPLTYKHPVWPGQTYMFLLGAVSINIDYTSSYRTILDHDSQTYCYYHIKAKPSHHDYALCNTVDIGCKT